MLAPESPVSAESPLLEARDLTKLFPVRRRLFGTSAELVRAVDGISFAIPAGKTLGLVGESGCGKTTTAKLVLRLEEPTGGVIRFQGRDLQALDRSGLREYRRSVQAVFQDPFASLNPRMRVGAITAEPLVTNEAVEAGELKRRVLRLLALVGLPDRSADLFPHEFSGGQRQRIAIARALALSPKLVVLDEPVSALDVSIRAQILNLLRDLQSELGLSYLFIAHDLAAVAHMSHSIAVMYLGKIVETGEADTPTRRHSSRRRSRPIRKSSGRRSSSPARCRARSARRPAAASTRAALERCCAARPKSRGCAPWMAVSPPATCTTRYPSRDYSFTSWTSSSRSDQQLPSAINLDGAVGMASLDCMGRVPTAGRHHCSALRVGPAGRPAGPDAGDRPAHAKLLIEPTRAQDSRRGGSLTSVQSSTPGTTGGEADFVVSVRPLLGENHTYSVVDSCPGTAGSSISGPEAPLSLRSAFRARFASCLALR